MTTTYTNNPAAMAAALEHMASLPTGRMADIWRLDVVSQSRYTLLSITDTDGYLRSNMTLPISILPTPTLLLDLLLQACLVPIPTLPPSTHSTRPPSLRGRPSEDAMLGRDANASASSGGKGWCPPVRKPRSLVLTCTRKGDSMGDASMAVQKPSSGSLQQPSQQYASHQHRLSMSFVKELESMIRERKLGVKLQLRFPEDEEDENHTAMYGDSTCNNSQNNNRLSMASISSWADEDPDAFVVVGGQRQPSGTWPRNNMHNYNKTPVAQVKQLSSQTLPRRGGGFAAGDSGYVGDDGDYGSGGTEVTPMLFEEGYQQQQQMSTLSRRRGHDNVVGLRSSGRGDDQQQVANRMTCTQLIIRLLLLIPVLNFVMVRLKIIAKPGGEPVKVRRSISIN